MFQVQVRNGGGRSVEHPHLHARQRTESLHERKQGGAPHPDLYRREGRRQERPRGDHGSGALLRTPDVQRHAAVRHFGLRRGETDARRDRKSLRGLPQDRRRGRTRRHLPPHRLDQLRSFENRHSQRVRQADVGHRRQRHQRLHVAGHDGLRRGHSLEPDRQLGQNPSRPFQESRDPRLPYRAGDHLRGEEHVPDAGQPQSLGSDGRRAVPQPPLRHADRAGYAGTSEKSVDHQRPKLPQDLLRAQQHGRMRFGRFRTRRNGGHDRKVLRRHAAQSQPARTAVRTRKADHDSRGEGGLRTRSGQRHAGLASAGRERQIDRHQRHRRFDPLQRTSRTDRPRPEPAAEGALGLRLRLDAARLQFVPRGRTPQDGTVARRSPRPASGGGGKTAGGGLR